MHEEWPALLNFSERTLDLDTLERRPHDPKDRFLYAAPFDYDPNATTLYYDLLLDLHLAEYARGLETLEEVLGYAIQPKRVFEIGGRGMGQRFNGKTHSSSHSPAILGATVVGPISCTASMTDKFASATRWETDSWSKRPQAVCSGPTRSSRSYPRESLLRGERKNAHPFSFMNNAVPSSSQQRSPHAR